MSGGARNRFDGQRWIENIIKERTRAALERFPARERYLYAAHRRKLLRCHKFFWNVAPKIRIEPRQTFCFRNVPCIFPFSHDLRLRVHFLLHIRI